MKERITCEECGFTHEYSLTHDNNYEAWLGDGEQCIFFYFSCPYNDEDTDKKCGNGIEVKKHFVFTGKTEVEQE
jgi:hypothetical protein